MRESLSVFLLTILLGMAAGTATAGNFSVYGGTTGDTSPKAAAELQERLRAQSAPLRAETARPRQRQRLAGEKSPAILNALVMMCDFSDSLLLGRYGEVPGDFPPPMQTDRLYAAHDSLFFDHMISKVSDYFTTVSGGRLDINYTVHGRAINLPAPMGFYGNDPVRGEQPILMASQVVDSLGAEIDLATFDTIILVHAGAGEETDILGNSPEQIFSTYLDPDDFAAAVEDSILAQPYLPAPGFPAGTGIDRVLILPETEQQDPFGGFGGGFGSLGVYCFEFGLHLGMLSLSDFTPSGRPDSQGIGQYGLMGYGLFVGLGFIPPHPCAFNKMLMGWLDPYDAPAQDGGRHYLTPSESPHDPLACARVDITGQEYWLLEYRLQDPNGDRRYSFGDDKNGNGLPDFYDMDSTIGGGIPTGKFDAATDSLERVIDAEWDFAMSENSAREFGELGWGSGVYVWHIDEGVIADVFDAPRNLFNADAGRKSVDLEEADGIQDLDSNQPSAYMLGSDDDSFRGEFTDSFRPDTMPRTDTAGGAWTGIAFTDFSNVVVDSFMRELFTDPQTGITYWAFDYADSMSFELGLVGEAGEGIQPYARRDLPAGTDLRGSHVLLGDLDQLGGTDEVVLAGHSGEIYVLDGDLNEFLDRDGNPATLAPFAVGTRLGEPADWNLPPAMGDVDGDGTPEILLTDEAGLYAFNADGSAVRALEAGSEGLYADVPGCRLPVVMLARSVTAPTSDVSAPVQAVAAGRTPAGAFLGFWQGADAAEVRIELGPGTVATTPVVGPGYLAVAVADTAGEAGNRLIVMELSVGGIPSEAARLTIPLQGVPGSLPLLTGTVPGSDPQAPQFYAVVVDTSGHGETAFFTADLVTPRSSLDWPGNRIVRAPMSLGGAFVDAEVLGRVGHGGDWLTGWPRRPLQGGLAGDPAWQGQPLVARLTGSTARLDQFVFPTRDGRLFATDAQGASVAGWPVAGPASSAGTPALGQLGGRPDADLVAIGTTDRIIGTTAAGGLQTEAKAEVVVWHDVAAADPVWGQYGGSAWRNGSFDATAWVPGGNVAAGTGLVPGSHFCFPSPLSEGPLQVSGKLRSPARVRVVVYTLEGEEVRRSAWQEAGAVDPFVVRLDLPGTVTGLYLCRLEVDTPGRGTESSVTQFAIVR